MALSGPDDGATASGEVLRTMRWIEDTVTPVGLDQVRTIGHLLRERDTRSEVEARAWLLASELTATRAAFALVGDLEACARLTAAEPASALGMSSRERVADLCWSSITDEVAAVRAALGLTGSG